MEKMSFTSPLGKYQFHALWNVPAMFQEIIDQMFDGIISYVVRYIDDLVVYSTTWKEHLTCFEEEERSRSDNVS